MDWFGLAYIFAIQKPLHHKNQISHLDLEKGHKQKIA